MIPIFSDRKSVLLKLPGQQRVKKKDPVSNKSHTGLQNKTCHQKLQAAINMHVISQGASLSQNNKKTKQSKTEKQTSLL